MASGKRASMREGPLAQLFRKTDEDEPGRRAAAARDEPCPEEPRGGRPLPRPGPEPQVQPGACRSRAPRARAPEPRRAARDAATPRPPRPPAAPRRAPSAAARAGRARTRIGRYDGVPTPEERLRSVFSSDIPENIMERAPERERDHEPAPSIAARRRGSRREPVLRVVGVGGAGVNAVNRMIEAQVEGVEFIAVNTDMQSLEQSSADNARAHRQREHPWPRLGLEPRARPHGGDGGVRPPQGRCSRARTWCSSPPAPAAAPAPARRRSWRASPARSARSRSGIVTKPFAFEGARAGRAGRAGRRGPRTRGRHAHRDPERAPAHGARQDDVDGRGLPRGRRRAAPGRAGHLRPDHPARADQPRLRRRAHDHVRGRPGAARDRHGHGRSPRHGRRGARDRVAAARDLAGRRPLDPAVDHRRPRPLAVGGQRGRQGGGRGRPPRREHHLRGHGRREGRGPGLGHRRGHRLRRPPAVPGRQPAAASCVSRPTPSRACGADATAWPERSPTSTSPSSFRAARRLADQPRLR